nr:mitochondrial nicotinamide adenine dinucleotide transporter 1 [Quercus suber]
MQTMKSADGDTHDHGPPATITSQGTATLRKHTPYARLATWSTKLSDPAINSFSGAAGGFASGIVTCPLDVIKTKLQAQGAFANPGLKSAEPRASVMYHGMLGTARTIIRQDGVRGMYRGLGPMLLGYLPTWAVYMAVYDSSRQYFFQNGYDETSGKQFIGRLYASLCAGACSTLATNPIWVIKTRLMSQVSKTAKDGVKTPWQYTSTFDAARKMYAAEGVKAFYSGLTPALLGLTHVAIQFPLYEYLKQEFTGLEMGETPAEHGKSAEHTVGILLASFLSKVCASTATYPHEVVRTRLQTQQRNAHPGSSHGNATQNHAEAVSPGGQKGNSPVSQSFQPKYRGVIQSVQMIYREEGWRAFYNGMGTNMIRAVPAAMTTMLTFESVKSTIGRLQEEGNEILAENTGRL